MKILPDKVYDILKWVAIIALPALSVAIRAIFEIWGIPLGAEISQTITVAAVFLGALLGVSSLTYKPKE